MRRAVVRRTLSTALALACLAAAALPPAGCLDGAEPPAAAPREAAPAASPPVVVYTTSWCGWCRRTLAHLDARGVPYQNKDIEADPAWAQELVAKTGSTAVPVIEIGGELVRGYDVRRIDRLLAAAQ